MNIKSLFFVIEPYEYLDGFSIVRMEIRVDGNSPCFTEGLYNNEFIEEEPEFIIDELKRSLRKLLSE